MSTRTVVHYSGFAMPPAQDMRPLIACFINAFRLGGMEQVLVTLLDRLPEDRFRHASNAQMSRPSPCTRLAASLLLTSSNSAATCCASSQPSLHSRSLGPLEGQWTAWMAGVPRRVHGEYGPQTARKESKASPCPPVSAPVIHVRLSS